MLKRLEESILKYLTSNEKWADHRMIETIGY